MLNKVTLNLQKRKKAFTKIYHDNIYLLKRIQQQKTVYNNKNYKTEERKRRAILKNICEYPYRPENFKSTSSFSNTASNFESSGDHTDTKDYGDYSNRGHSINDIYRPAEDSTISKPNKKIVHKSTQIINSKYYIIEISEIDSGESKHHLHVNVYPTESPHALTVDIDYEKSELIKQIFQSNYALLAQNINISNQNILITTPSEQ